jgi:hypothetical protein
MRKSETPGYLAVTADFQLECFRRQVLKCGDRKVLAHLVSPFLMSGAGESLLRHARQHLLEFSNR